MRGKSKKEEWEHKPPTHLTSDGVDAWYMMQRRRDQELRKRRQEAEQLLRGWRGSYQVDDSNSDFFSPTLRRGRASLGDVMSESLEDPLTLKKRRQSTMPRIQNNWAEGDSEFNKLERTPFSPQRTQFLFERKNYDGTQYQKFDDKNAFNRGRYLFGDDNSSKGTGIERREPSSQRCIDFWDSQAKQREAAEIMSGREEVDMRSMPGDNARENVVATDLDVPETIWRDFISSGKLSKKELA